MTYSVGYDTDNWNDQKIYNVEGVGGNGSGDERKTKDNFNRQIFNKNKIPENIQKLFGGGFGVSRHNSLNVHASSLNNSSSNSNLHSGPTKNPNSNPTLTMTNPSSPK